MKKQTNATIKAHVIQCAPYLLLLAAGSVMALFVPQAPTKMAGPAGAGLTLAERVSYQRAIETVYWRHRIWPKENPGPKPGLDAVMSEAELEKKVEDYLLDSQALEDKDHGPVKAEQLQAEMERMAARSKQPEVLRELFQALGNDPAVIAECLARPVLAKRMTTALGVMRSQTGLPKPEAKVMAAATANYTLPKIGDGGTGCTDDTWTATSVTNAPSARAGQAAVWTGTEMIIWGGQDANGPLQTGGRYNPSTDSWIPTSTVNAPKTLGGPAVWTGTEMIVWGGETCCPLVYFNTGGRYNPNTDTWVATSTVQAPAGRSFQTAVWTGTEMIVWGGQNNSKLNTGGRYNSEADSWEATSLTGAPSARENHTAIWTGSEMIVWGGGDGPDNFDTGAKYDPVTDTWLATTTSGAPSGRFGHTAVWDGAKMIVWGGADVFVPTNTGGKYDPFTDSWSPTTTVSAPSGRIYYTAVWTGSEMINWGGAVFTDGGNTQYFNTGGRYNPFTDSWTATSTVNAPSQRYTQSAIWTGSQMIVWGGGSGDRHGFTFFNNGGKYCATVGPTPAPTPVPIVLHGEGNKVKGINTTHLAWSQATSAQIDVYRDGAVIATTANDDFYDDSIGNGNQAAYTYKVCDAGTQTCSNELTVSFEQSINATWSANPVSGDWNDARNWTPPTVPNSPFARATFNTSTITDISLSNAIEVTDVIFKPGASAFTITIPAQKTLTLTGAGVTNNSGQEQNFVITSGTIFFQGASTAGNNILYTCDGGVQFADSSSAGKSMFVFGGGTVKGLGGAGASFRDNTSAANATFVLAGGTVRGASGSTISFFDGQVSAGTATIIANGGAVAGALGAEVDFFAIQPSEPTLMGNGGVNGGKGAVFFFFEDIPGNLAHFQLNGDALLDISIAGDVTIGSLAGDGTVDLGDFTLSVGGNNQSTIFSGLLDQINTEGGAAGLKKVGSGTLRLSHDNMFKGGVTIAAGTLAIDNQSGSASGSDGVAVQEGTLSGGGITAGGVDIGTGSGQGAFLAPGQGAGTAKTLTIQETVTFKADGTYTWKLNTKKAKADQVVANGVTIESGAQFDFNTIGNKKLTTGKVFTAINNTATTPISGAFSNLSDGGTVTVGVNKLQVNYAGGDGNDLTLTVVQ